MFLRRLFCFWVTISFVSTLIIPPQQANAQTVMDLPAAGTMVSVSPSFNPALIKGLTVHKDNPFLFDFIVDPGQSKYSKEALKEESDRMIRYFFASLTLPDKDIWVNLSPYEKDRMIPVSLGKTAMGRDLLAQDYMLKQLTASLIYPQKALGKTFWDTVYSRAKEMYGTTQIPINTFNKVWIVPQRAGVYEHGQTAFIVEGHLKVMLEQDYLSITKHNAITNSSVTTDSGVIASEAKQSQLGSQIIRQIILPEIEKEVNEGKNFATLRQIFYAQVLAVWFKRNLKQALLNQVYANKGTVKGIDQNDAATNEAIYRQYLKAYKKGVFNFIQEDIDPVTQETLPRKYFSGGYGDVGKLSINPAQLSDEDKAQASNDVDFAVMAVGPKDAASLSLNIDRAMNRNTLGKIALAGAGALLIGHLLYNHRPNNNKNSAPTVQGDTSKNQSSQKINPEIAWMLNNVYQDDLGKGFPKSFDVPERSAWNSIGDNSVDGVQERVNINAGSDLYDGAVRQIVLAMAGGQDNFNAADIYTNDLLSGNAGDFQTLRAWQAPFRYQKKTLPEGNAYFFRMITNKYLQYDPLDSSRVRVGYPDNLDQIHWTDWMPVTGENAWVILGSLQMAYAKGHGTIDVNSPEMKLALSLVPAFEALRTPIGAILYAPEGTFNRNPNDISSENNVSTHSAFMKLYAATNDEKYLKMAQGIEDYFQKYGYDKNNHVFYQGGLYSNGNFSPNREHFAVDVQTWGITEFSPEKIDKWYGEGEAYQIWKNTKERAGYKNENGQLMGVGFTDGNGILSGEWSYGAIAATLELAIHYQESHPDWSKECENDAISMLNGLESLKRNNKGGGISYLYANKRFFIPFGWWANPVRSLASTAWAYLIQNGKSPFVLGGETNWFVKLPRFKAAANAITAGQKGVVNSNQASSSENQSTSAKTTVTEPSTTTEQPVATEQPVSTEQSTSTKSIQLTQAGHYSSSQFKAKSVYFDFGDNTPLKLTEGQHLTFKINVKNVNSPVKIRFQLLPVGGSEDSADGSLEPMEVKPGEQDITITVPSKVDVKRIVVQYGQNDAEGDFGGSWNTEVSILGLTSDRAMTFSGFSKILTVATAVILLAGNAKAQQIHLPVAGHYSSSQWHAKSVYFDFGENTPLKLKAGQHLTFKINVSSVSSPVKIKFQLLSVGDSENSSAGSLDPITVQPGEQNVTITVPNTIDVKRIVIQSGEKDASGYFGGNMEANVSVENLNGGNGASTNKQHVTKSIPLTGAGHYSSSQYRAKSVYFEFESPLKLTEGQHLIFKINVGNVSSPVKVRFQLLAVGDSEDSSAGSLDPITVNPGEQDVTIKVPSTMDVRRIVVQYGENDADGNFGGNWNTTLSVFGLTSDRAMIFSGFKKILIASAAALLLAGSVRAQQISLPAAGHYSSSQYRAKSVYFEFESPLKLKTGQHLTFKINVGNVTGPVKVRFQLLPVGGSEGTSEGSLEPITVKPGEQNVTITVPGTGNVRRIVIQYGENDADGNFGGNWNTNVYVEGLKFDKAMGHQLITEQTTPVGGIDLSQQDSALYVEKDANGGVQVNVDPALIARIEREGMSEVVPVIINMKSADIQALFGVTASI